MSNDNHDPANGQFSDGGGGGSGKDRARDRGRGVKSFADRIAKNNASIEKTHAAMDQHAAAAHDHTKEPSLAENSSAENQRLARESHARAVANPGQKRDLPPHMKALLERANKYTIADVTPKGYGPGG